MELGLSKLRGVLLVGFGGPDSPDSVKPFMTRLMGGREPGAELVARVQERYRAIGGRSPLLDITRTQAAALEEVLNREGKSDGPYRVYVGMSYWHPLIEDALYQMRHDGVEEIIAVSLSPHASRVTTGTYRVASERALQQLRDTERGDGKNGAFVDIRWAQPWYDHPSFINALASKAWEALAKLPAEGQQQVKIIFTAHSLPVSYIEQGDPYLEQVQRTVDLLQRKLMKKNGLTSAASLSSRPNRIRQNGQDNGEIKGGQRKAAGESSLTGISFHLAFQSKGAGQGKWLGPEVEEVLASLAGQGAKYILLIPVGFVAEHVETLYDIDILHRRRAKELGLDFVRAAAVCDHPEFIAALANVVRRASY